MMTAELSREMGAISNTPTAYEARLSGDWTRIIDELDANGGKISKLSKDDRLLLKTARDESKNMDAAWERYHREKEEEIQQRVDRVIAQARGREQA